MNPSPTLLTLLDLLGRAADLHSGQGAHQRWLISTGDLSARPEWLFATLTPDALVIQRVPLSHVARNWMAGEGLSYAEQEALVFRTGSAWRDLVREQSDLHGPRAAPFREQRVTATDLLVLREAALAAGGQVALAEAWTAPLLGSPLELMSLPLTGENLAALPGAAALVAR